MYLAVQTDAVEEAHAQEILAAASYHNTHQQGLVAAMSHEHRTRQQDFTRLMVSWIEYLANLDAGEYDLRNQASVELAKQLVQTPNWEKLKFLPAL